MLIVLEENLRVKKNEEQNTVDFVTTSTAVPKVRLQYDVEGEIIRYEDAEGNFYDKKLMGFDNPFNYNFDYSTVHYDRRDFAFAGNTCEKKGTFTFDYEGPTYHTLANLKKKERKKVVFYFDKAFYRLKKYDTNISCDFDGCELWATVKVERIF